MLDTVGKRPERYVQDVAVLLGWQRGLRGSPSASE